MTGCDINSVCVGGVPCGCVLAVGGLKKMRLCVRGTGHHAARRSQPLESLFDTKVFLEEKRIGNGDRK